MQSAIDPGNAGTPGLVAIVDDDAAMRRSIERLLQARGYATMAFANAEDFLLSPPSGAILALVLDIHLQGMSGLDLCRHLQAARTVRPIVFITARGNAAARAEAMSLGCIAYLEKPFDADSLAQALEHAGPAP
jgi:FixJ family two-component response regulator